MMRPMRRRRSGQGPHHLSAALRARWEWMSRDAANFVNYGRCAPRYAELQHMALPSCSFALWKEIPRDATGSVLAGDWDAALRPVEEVPKVAWCLAHWRDGLPWHATGAFEAMMVKIQERGVADGCRTFADVVHRYERLDDLFENVRKEGRLRTRREVDRNGFRESGGIYVHVARSGAPIFGGGGCHRLGLALVLQLPAVPVQIGVVHRMAVRSWRDGFVNREGEPVSAGS
jgi:hypothetical protein